MYQPMSQMWPPDLAPQFVISREVMSWKTIGKGSKTWKFMAYKLSKKTGRQA